MKNMEKPRLEVVRFGAEDVIATSGTPAVFSAANGNYFTIGSEYRDSGATVTNTNSNKYYSIAIENGTASSRGKAAEDAPTSGNYTIYAWYHEGWYTHKLPADDPFYSDGFGDFGTN